MDVKNTRDKLSAVNAALQKSVFDDVNLSNSTFMNIDFSGAIFEDVNLTNAAIDGASLDGMTIDGVLVTDMIAAYRAAQGGEGSDDASE